ncbi:response regulator transcription factor [uncultured Pseudodesulfovibrio sp.]|uniref:response regulator transcription factor n=1 Tax=uncultured Pseudodesulfovibrio sp. TaxID=2035858 RepID=UPI0029C6716B|nr:response regulator transcription factor [uncultured Pseudodesulfovibrio sp.]
MNIMIVDDHPLFREGLKAIVSRNEKFEVVAEAGNGKDGIRLAKKHKPDIVIMDISMPGKNGIQVIRELRNKLSDTKFLIISMHSEAEYLLEAFRAGATGYMIKESAASNLEQGLDTVARGELFLDSALSQEVVYRLLQDNAQDSSEAQDPYSTLTAREQEVMRMLAEGLNAKEVAAQLYISPKTVENHRTNLMKKLDLHSSVELVRYAAKLGLIDLETWVI